MQQNKLNFSDKILKWHADNGRKLPWVGEKNPYLIWISEIILQQTRVAQGLPYYKKFIERFPDVQTLAEASEDEVLYYWKGLGYYRRAKNIHASAKLIVNENNGHFPETYQNIRNLKGVGDYTAAAIASFAFGEAHPVVDGNVYRIIARFFGIQIPVDQSEGKKLITKLAGELLDKNNPAAYNQAIMDFGATQCVPKNPDCNRCPLSNNCQALKKSMVNELPVKQKRLVKKTRFFNFLDISYNGSLALIKRTQNDIWQGLYQMPLVETDKEIVTIKSLEWKMALDPILKTEHITFKEGPVKISQMLTHQKIKANFWHFELRAPKIVQQKEELFVELKKLDNFALPKVIERYIELKY